MQILMYMLNVHALILILPSTEMKKNLKIFYILFNTSCFCDISKVTYVCRVTNYIGTE